MSPTTSLLTDSEISRGLRRGRVLSGERMVTPRKHLSLVVNGRTEELRPGRDRLRPDHWTVREHPEWFKPADPNDLETNRRHRATCERKLRRTGTTTRATTSTTARKPFRLPDAGRGSYRLP